MFGKGLTRRDLVGGAAAAGAFGLGGFGAMPFAFGQGTVNWKKFAGQEIGVNLVKSPRGELLTKYEKEFTDLTGIKVSSEMIPEQQQRQKVVIELSSGKPGFDVVHLSYHVQKRQFEKAGWLADFSGFIKDPSMTTPDLVESDFSDAGLKYARNAKGELRSLPWSVDYFILYWNKELFAKKGLAYPATMDDMVKAAAALTDPKEGTFGFVCRGLRNANLPPYMNLLLGYGGDALDANGNLATDSAEAIEAAKLYQTLLTKYAPPGIAGFNWAECQAAFIQGKVGMWLDGVGFAPPVEDPNKSRVVGKVGYGVVPKGPKVHASCTFGDGIGVAEASTKKEAGYLYCQWAVSKLMGTRLLQAGGGVPFRNSVLNDPAIRQGLTMPGDWLDSVIGSAKVSKLGLPVIVPVAEFRDTIGTGLTALIAGADPATEMKKATEAFRPILERSEKG